jgi:hypothetical protein
MKTAEGAEDAEDFWIFAGLDFGMSSSNSPKILCVVRTLCGFGLSEG